MKTCYKNTPIKNRKKKRNAILTCAAILMIGCALSGCSMSKEDPGNGIVETEDIKEGEAEDVSGRSEPEDAQMEQESVDDTSAGNDTPEETMILTFMKGGEQEQKQAALTEGDGYYIYLPENEWQPSGPDLWTASVNEQVQFWITHFEGESADLADQKLEDDGYVTEQDHHKRKEEGDVIYHVELKDSGDGAWGVFYSYPVDAEEGWGRELPVIADTFAVSAGADGDKNNGGGSAGEYLGDEDCLEIKNIAEEFAAAYFDGDTDTVRKYLAGTFEGEADTYEGTGTVSGLTVKGLSDTDEKKVEDGRYTVSLEFRDSSYEDMFLYLTVVFIRQEEGWKVQSYGVEG